VVKVVDRTSGISAGTREYRKIGEIDGSFTYIPWSMTGKGVLTLTPTTTLAEADVAALIAVWEVDSDETPIV